MMHTRTLLTVIAAAALLGLTASCPGKGGAKPQLQVPLDETALSVVNRLALYKPQSEDDPAEYTAAREQALREARDAVLDSGNPFEARVTIACWLQQMRQELPDRVIPELTSEAPGHLELDPRILFSLAQLTWNAAQQAAQDPFRWHEEEPAGRRGELALSLFRQASDAAPQSALFALTAASNDLFLTGKLNGTLISWNWPQDTQEECAGRIKPLLERFIAAKDNTCMTGPPYFTPLTNAQSYPPDAVGGGVYDGSTASSLLPATAVLVLRDMVSRRNTEELRLATDVVAKLLAMEPQSYARLSAAAISAREIAQTLTEAMAGPSERGAVNDLAADMRSFHRAMDEDWLNRYAKDYAETAPKNYERARRMETGFIARYIRDMKTKVARMADFISTLKPEDILTDAPPAPW